MSTPFWGPDFAALAAEDPEIADVVVGELHRLRGGLQLIASENLTSAAVLAALGSTLSNKYAEGYPGRRYYGGCEVVDRAETIGIERAKELFGCEHANLQPHSGAQANFAAYGALLTPGDTVLAMSLPHGGHLTHGSKVNFSGKWFSVVGYGVDPETELIDYDEVARLADAVDPRTLPPFAATPEAVGVRGRALVAAVAARRNGVPADPADELPDPWGRDEAFFERTADVVEEHLAPLVRVLSGR